MNTSERVFWGLDKGLETQGAVICETVFFRYFLH